MTNSTHGASPISLLDPAFLAKLEQLGRIARKVLAGERAIEGGAHSLRHAPGGETSFQEHRSYSPGDDPRRIDWNAYGRLGELFVKVFEPEKRGEIAVLLDRSASMREARPGALALQLAAAFGFLGICGLDGALLAPFPGFAPERFRGEESGLSLLRRLDGLESKPAESNTLETMEQAAQWVASQRHRPGWIVLLSDFYPPSALEKSLPGLRGARVLCVQIFDPLDWEPPERGPSRFEDPETGRRRRIPVTAKVRENYLALLRAQFDRVEKLAREYGARSLRVAADTPFESAMLGILSRGALGG